ncbi:MAG: tetratricopeptide repeat protein [Saprospiraceae bacterium]
MQADSPPLEYVLKFCELIFNTVHMEYFRLRFLLLALSLLLGVSLSAAGYFRYHTEAQTIYKKIFELKLTEAAAMTARMKASEPDNLVVHHLEDYIDFFKIFVSEDEALYKKLLPNLSTRLDRVSSGDETSPYYLYTQAEIRLHWALLKFRFEDYFSAFTDINRAHKLLLENNTRFPDFLANKKDLGILHAAVGTVPDNYRWALEMLSSLEGSVEQGKREVEEVLTTGRRTGFIFQQETQVLYVFLLLHLDGRPDAAWQALENAALRPAETPLHAFVMANVAMRTGRNEQAIRWMEAAPRGTEFFTFPYLDYMLGVAKLRRLDTSARKHLLTFLNNTHGRHYIKEAYQKLAWAEWLDGRESGYRRYMQLVTTQGAAAAGGDKNALKEAQLGKLPNLTLLQARLLYDGGYYERGMSLLNNKQESSFSDFLNRLEFVYRKGRILHGMERYAEALETYDRTITLGQQNDAFFACNAALQAGMIAEKLNRKETAKSYYRKCLSLSPADYQTSLHQQAKAGLNRLGR